MLFQVISKVNHIFIHVPNPFLSFLLVSEGVEGAKRLSPPQMFEHLQEDSEEDDDSEEAAFQNIQT